jgi:hypothetical protein
MTVMTFQVRFSEDADFCFSQVTWMKFLLDYVVLLIKNIAVISCNSISPDFHSSELIQKVFFGSSCFRKIYFGVCFKTWGASVLRVVLLLHKCHIYVRKPRQVDATPQIPDKRCPKLQN